MDTSTADPFKTSPPTTCAATPSVTSSPVSAAGPRRSDDPEFGRIIARFGREAVLANLSPSRASKLGLLTSGTYGPLGTGSSSSAALQRSLENRLRPLLNGSDLCEVTWKPWNTPWGSCLSRPRARVRSTCGTGTGLWATLSVKGNYNRKGLTPKSGDGLATQVLALWATAAARDWRSDRSQKTSAEMYGAKGRPLARQAIEAQVWPTPRAQSALNSGPSRTGCRADIQTVALWSTARASPNENRTTRATPPQMDGKHGQYLAVQALNGSSEPTEKRGSLNPEFVCWLMGYPSEWLSCAPSEMPSTSARLPRSSKRRAKVSLDKK
jgi:hypothetical protein